MKKKIYEQLEDVIATNGDNLTYLDPGTEEHKRAADEYVSLWKIKNDIDNRKQESDKARLERDLKMAVATVEDNSRRRDTKWRVASLVGCFAFGTVVENFGGMRSKFGEIVRTIKP